MAKKGSILVVDDEEIMRDVLEVLLSSAGYKVDLAKTGGKGLEKRINCQNRSLNYPQQDF